MPGSNRNKHQLRTSLGSLTEVSSWPGAREKQPNRSQRNLCKLLNAWTQLSRVMVDEEVHDQLLLGIAYWRLPPRSASHISAQRSLNSATVSESRSHESANANHDSNHGL